MFLHRLKDFLKYQIDKLSLPRSMAKNGYMRGVDFYAFYILPICIIHSLFTFKRIHGVFPSLINPKGFNEKIVWFKYFGLVKIPEYGNKLLTSSFIPDELKEEVRCPKIVWHSQVAKLPDNDQITPGHYYLKANYGAGMWTKIQYPLTEEKRLIFEKLGSSWLQKPPTLIRGEWWYSCFDRELMLEESVTRDMDSEAWCFYIFNTSNPFTSVVMKIQSRVETIWLDASGMPHEYQKDKSLIQDFKLPENFSKLQSIAIEIGKKYGFVRVDLLISGDGKIFLGEMTFSPGSGNTKREEKVDKELGALWIHK